MPPPKGHDPYQEGFERAVAYLTSKLEQMQLVNSAIEELRSCHYEDHEDVFSALQSEESSSLGESLVQYQVESLTPSGVLAQPQLPLPFTSLYGGDMNASQEEDDENESQEEGPSRRRKKKAWTRDFNMDKSISEVSADLHYLHGLGPLHKGIIVGTLTVDDDLSRGENVTQEERLLFRRLVAQGRNREGNTTWSPLPVNIRGQAPRESARKRRIEPKKVCFNQGRNIDYFREFAIMGTDFGKAGATLKAKNDLWFKTANTLWQVCRATNWTTGKTIREEPGRWKELENRMRRINSDEYDVPYFGDDNMEGDPIVERQALWDRMMSSLLIAIPEITALNAKVKGPPTNHDLQDLFLHLAHTSDVLATTMDHVRAEAKGVTFPLADIRRARENNLLNAAETANFSPRALDDNVSRQLLGEYVNPREVRPKVGAQEGRVYYSFQKRPDLARLSINHPLQGTQARQTVKGHDAYTKMQGWVDALRRDLQAFYNQIPTLQQRELGFGEGFVTHILQERAQADAQASGEIVFPQPAVEDTTTQQEIQENFAAYIIHTQDQAEALASGAIAEEESISCVNCGESLCICPLRSATAYSSSLDRIDFALSPKEQRPSLVTGRTPVCIDLTLSPNEEQPSDLRSIIKREESEDRLLPKDPLRPTNLGEPNAAITAPTTQVITTTIQPAAPAPVSHEITVPKPTDVAPFHPIPVIERIPSRPSTPQQVAEGPFPVPGVASPVLSLRDAASPRVAKSSGKKKISNEKYQRMMRVIRDAVGEMVKDYLGDDGKDDEEMTM
jgi:hypothetical protein